MVNKRKMKKFSDSLNFTFGLLNSLTNSEIFESHVLSNGNLEIRILGRDGEFDNKLEEVKRNQPKTREWMLCWNR